MFQTTPLWNKVGIDNDSNNDDNEMMAMSMVISGGGDNNNSTESFEATLAEIPTLLIWCFASRSLGFV